MPLKSKFRRLAPFLAILAFIVLACGIVGNEKQAQSFSFNNSFDTLAKFDSVVITLRDTTGKTIDILYRGKADTIREVENRLAPHWDGEGIAVLSIIGYDSGIVVYRVDKKINGANDQVLDTIRVILPNTFLISDALDITMTEGDSVGFPKINVTPLELSNKTLSYASSAPGLLQVGTSYLRALQRGSTKLTATLNSNPNKSLVFNVTILANPLTPDSLRIFPDTLSLAQGGAPGTLAVKAQPLSADARVDWKITDATIAQVNASGLVHGIKTGTTLAIATSKRKPSLSDTVLIVVNPPVAVTQVRFLNDSLDIFVGGAAESLLVEVLPHTANPTVELLSLDRTLVVVSAGRVHGLAEGRTQVVVKSSENPLLSDTLKITILPTQKIDGVKLTPDSLRLYVGGAIGALAAAILPASANQSVLWHSQDAVIAKVDGLGKVTGLSAGATLIVCQSRVDSTKKDTAVLLVKRDAPVVSVGIDTVVSLNSLHSIGIKT